MSIIVKDLTYKYGEKKVLDNINFEVQSGVLLCVLGPNGVGKTTLFRCILGLNNKTIYQGKIEIDGLNIKKLKIRNLAKHIAYIPQSHYPTFNYKVLDIVLMSTGTSVGNLSMPGTEQKRIAYEALERIGIAELADRGYAMISGGERQLVLIARALAQQAKIIIMDEPTANLDYGNQVRILSQIKKLAGEGYTVVLSTHNPDQAFLYADQVLVLNNGKVLKHGDPKEILTEVLIKDIYGVNVELKSLYNDEVRVCIPIDEILKYKDLNNSVFKNVKLRA